MQLLAKVPSIEDYYRDLKAILNDRSTHIYVDTSFLMWISKLGNSARTEFFEWTKEIGEDKIHVPLWASHEYHQHFINSTILKNVGESTSKLNQAATDFYLELLPAIVEANVPPLWSSDQIKTDTRDAILKLMRSSSVVNSWCDKTWDERSSAIIKFINRCCLKSGKTFEYLGTTIGQTTDNRFSGRVPPGFQDRVKKDTHEGGGNRSGDLIIWKEILDHARYANRRFSNMWRNEIESIIVLTNDGKNDWMAGGKSASPDGSIERLKGVQGEKAQIPIIHPMLEHEAQVYSRVHRVMLMNSFALGMHFYSNHKAPTFVEITISIKMPRYDHKAPILEKAPPASAEANVSASTHMAPLLQVGGDLESVATETSEHIMPPLLLQTYATSEPQKMAAEIGPIVDEILSVSGAAKPITDWLSKDLLNSSDKKCLIWIGRLLAGRAIQNVINSTTRLIDMLGMLDEVEASPAAQLYTGILFGIYFDDNNLQRVGLKPEFLQIVFNYQRKGFAKPCLQALHNAFGSEDQPVYLPTSEYPEIEAEVITKILNNIPFLSDLIISKINFLIPVGENDPRSLYRLLGINSELKKESVSIENLIFTAARILGFPIKQIRLKGDHKRKINISETDGLNITMNGDNSDD